VAGSASKATATEDDATPGEKIPGISSGQINTLPRPTGSSSPEKKNAAANSTPPDVTQTPTTAVPSGHSPFDLSQIKEYLQRLPDWLKSAATGPGSGAGTPPKQ
jgi:hypothetical protein